VLVQGFYTASPLLDESHRTATVRMVSPLSATFLIFALVSGLLSQRYKADAKKRTWALCGVTLLFWAWMDIRNAVVLCGVSTWVWYVTHRIEGAVRGTRAHTWWRRGGVLGVLCVLVWFKALPELGGFIADAQGRESMFERWWQPLGIAILALQAVMYIVDVSRRDAPAGSLPEAALVCGFFPRALAGPLVRAGSFVGQLRRDWDGRVPLERVAVLVMAACIKRYVLIETLMRYDALTTSTNRDLGAWDSLWHLLVGPMLTVLDVAAYTELALAAALMSGITLPENFNAPFSGWTVSEMWRRWHITVSGFFRDYVIAPLRGNSTSATRGTFAIIGGVSAIGLWHTMQPAMLLWSVLLGLPMAYEAVSAQRRAKNSGRFRRTQPKPVRRWAQAVFVYLYISSFAQLFHGAGVGDAVRSLQSLTNPLWATHWTSPWVLLCIVSGWAYGAGLFAWLGTISMKMLSRMPSFMVGLFCAIVVTMCAAFSDGGIPRFYYQRLG
jgi:D-alanyl-lipoteichoic acid acyltransferase DltB (MBOAT superfamily)